MKVLALFHGLVLSKQEKRNTTAQIKKETFLFVFARSLLILVIKIFVCVSELPVFSSFFPFSTPIPEFDEFELWETSW